MLQSLSIYSLDIYIYIYYLDIFLRPHENKSVFIKSLVYKIEFLSTNLEIIFKFQVNNFVELVL